MGARHAGSRRERRRRRRGGQARLRFWRRRSPITAGHRQRLRERFRKGGADALARLRAAWSSCCSGRCRGATPRASPSGCIARFGSLRRGGQRARAAAQGSRRRWRQRRHRAEARSRRRPAPDARRDRGAAGARHPGSRCSTICAPRRATSTASSSASCFSTRRISSSPTRSSSRAPSTTRRSTCARW